MQATFEIIETPLGQFTLRHTSKDSTRDYGPFKDKEAAELGMTRIILSKVYHYSAIGAPLD